MTWSPERPIEIIAGTPAGGGQDRAARAFASALPFETYLTNVPGRGGGNGWDLLARRIGDPHVVSISSPTLITNKLQGGALIDHADLTPLAQLCTESLVFAVGSDRDFVTVGDVLTAITQREPVALATARGNVNHIAVGLIADHVGVDPGEVPVVVFDSARNAVADVLAGNASLAVVSAASVLPEVATGTVRVVAVTAATRMAAPFERVPTWRESGVDCVIGTWRGLIGPARLQPEHIAFWDRAVAAAVVSDPWRAALAEHRWDDTHLDATATRVFLDEERVRLAAALKGLGDG
ncbi:MAG: tripartite tricarboxylate transporter substrate-binding protein [Acidimicrobiia bacterium]